MKHQTKATHFSLFMHASLVLSALLFAQHAVQVKPPLVMDFSILPAGLSATPSPAAAAPPAPSSSKRMAEDTVKESKPKPLPAKKVAPSQRLAKVVRKTTPPPLAQAEEAAEAPVVNQRQQTEPSNPAPAVADAGAEDSASSTTASTTAKTTGAGQAGSSSGQGGGGIFSAGQLDAPLAVLTKSPPIYPHGAKRRNIEGWIKVKFVVDEQGQVGQVKVLAAEPEGVFEQSVLQCIARWRFKPGTIGGRAVKALVEQTISFKLEG